MRRGEEMAVPLVRACAGVRGPSAARSEPYPAPAKCVLVFARLRRDSATQLPFPRGAVLSTAVLWRTCTVPVYSLKQKRKKNEGRTEFRSD